MVAAIFLYLEAEDARKVAVKETRNAKDVVRFFTHDVLAAVKPENTADREITMREVFESAAGNLEETLP